MIIFVLNFSDFMIRLRNTSFMNLARGCYKETKLFLDLLYDPSGGTEMAPPEA
jgi:hypothetical protein